MHPPEPIMLEHTGIGMKISDFPTNLEEYRFLRLYPLCNVTDLSELVISTFKMFPTYSRNFELICYLKRPSLSDG